MIDFLNTVEKYYEVKEFSISIWKELWLETSSFNVLEVEWDPLNITQTAKMLIKQRPNTQDYPKLRPHRIKIGLFLEDGSADVIEVLLMPQAQTVINFNNSKQYKAILLNYDDESFVKMVLDPTSLEYFSENMSKIKDILN